MMALTDRMPSFPRVILPIIAIGAIILSIFLVMGSQPDRELTTPTETPPRANAALTGRDSVAGAGIVEPSSEVITIGSDVAGVVDRLYVEAGQQVAAGQPLFTIDARQVRASIAEAESAIGEARASVANAQAALTTANQQLALYRSVEDPRAISRQEVIQRQGVVTQARAQLALAQAQVRAAQARRASAMTELARHTIRAPISAEVLRVRIRPGEFVQSGGPQASGADPYMEIGATRPLHVRIDIDEDEVSQLVVGSDASITPRGNTTRPVRASFVRVEPQIIPKRSLTNASAERVDVRVLQVIYALPPETSGFFVGQQVDAFVPRRSAAQNAPARTVAPAPPATAAR
jgi:HlyD family secretion protein